MKKLSSKVIPKNEFYCYEYLKPIENGGFECVGLCPYWISKKYGAYCMYLKNRSEDGDPFNLIWDQCKECGK